MKFLLKQMPDCYKSNIFIMSLSHFYQGLSKLSTNQPPDFRKVIIKEDLHFPTFPQQKLCVSG